LLQAAINPLIPGTVDGHAGANLPQKILGAGDPFARRFPEYTTKGFHLKPGGSMSHLSKRVLGLLAAPAAILRSIRQPCAGERSVLHYLLL
jgi:hypothetical protein